MIRKLVRKQLAKGSKTITNGSQDSRKKPLDQLDDLLLDDDAWAEDSRVSIEQLHIGYPPHSKRSESKWPHRRRIAGVSGAIVLGVLAAIKTAWELGWLDFVR